MMGMKIPAGMCHKCLGKTTKGKFCDGCRPPSKYHSNKTTVGDWQFDSQKEADRYRHLATLEKANLISGLTCQPRFPLIINGVKVGTYVADFTYYEGPNLSGARVVEDVKGYKTRIYNLKRKLMLAIYSIAIREV